MRITSLGPSISGIGSKDSYTEEKREKDERGDGGGLKQLSRQPSTKLGMTRLPTPSPRFEPRSHNQSFSIVPTSDVIQRVVRYKYCCKSKSMSPQLSSPSTDGDKQQIGSPILVAAIQPIPAEAINADIKV